MHRLLSTASTNSWENLSSTLQNLFIVYHGLKTFSHFLKLVDLLGHESLLLSDFLLDFFKKHVDCLLFILREEVQRFEKSALISRLRDFYI
jgi:hypothetical protein